MGDPRTIGEQWGAEAQDWATIQEPTSDPLWNAMLDATHVGKGTNFLDAGCAAGGASLLANDRGAVITGVDVAANSIAIAKSRLPDATFLVEGIGAMSFADASFDAVICVNVIQFVPDVGKALADLVRVAKPGAKVSVAIFGPPESVDENTVFNAIASLLPPPRPTFPEYKFSQPGKLEELMAAAGLRDIVFAESGMPFDYPDAETGWRGQRSAGSIQDAIDKVGEGKVHQAVLDAFAKYQQPDGSIRMRNTMWYATGTRP